MQLDTKETKHNIDGGVFVMPPNNKQNQSYHLEDGYFPKTAHSLFNVLLLFYHNQAANTSILYLLETAHTFSPILGRFNVEDQDYQYYHLHYISYSHSLTRMGFFFFGLEVKTKMLLCYYETLKKKPSVILSHVRKHKVTVVPDTGVSFIYKCFITENFTISVVTCFYKNLFT